MKYVINQHIPACHVNRDFLNKLEDYIKSKIPNLIGISKKILSEKYSITISDEKGKEEMNSISNYTSNLFPDSIKDIKIMVFIFREKDFQLSINFNKEQLGRYSNNIEISYESKKAREIVLGIHEGIKQIIESYRNHNEFYYLGEYNDIFIFPASIFLFYISLIMLSDKYYAFFVIFFFAGLLILIYNVIGKKFKPFITFETNHYFRVQKSYSTFKAILIAVIATIIVTYFMGVWEKLKAWIE